MLQAALEDEESDDDDTSDSLDSSYDDDDSLSYDIYEEGEFAGIIIFSRF